MKKITANVDVNPTGIESAENINALKAQMLNVQMEIDIPKEAIDVLKKPWHRPDSSHEPEKCSDNRCPEK